MRKSQSVFQRVGAKPLVWCGALLILITVQVAFAQDNKTSDPGNWGRIVIQNVTEDAIITKQGTYPLTSDARIYDQKGKKVDIRYLAVPCKARVMFEKSPGSATAYVTNIEVTEVLVNNDVYRNRISKIPE